MLRSSAICVRFGIGAAIVSAGVALPGTAAAKTLFDYFLPVPIINALSSNGWGASNVQPRDQDNGLEDKANEYSYWDGRIVKASDGKFHLFASRWDESAGHWGGWPESSCVHAVSESSPLGPFIDKGLCYSDANGKGHNVMASQLPDGRYFILVSETRRPAVIYTSTSLDGPWTKEGTITTDANGYPVDASSGGNLHSNTTMWVRPDGSILATARDGVIMLSTSGILGPYKVQGTSVYANISFTPGGTPEDPALWYSGGQYHMVYSYPLDRKAYHLTSADGIHDWQNAGLAWDATKPFIKYTDGTVNTWNKLERPQVYLEDGHVKYFSFAAIDVDKGDDGGNDNHGSKVIVVPFDGVTFDAETGIDDGNGGAGGAGGAGDAGRAGATSGDGGADAATGGSAAGGASGSGGATNVGGSPGSGGRIGSGGAGLGGASSTSATSGGAGATGGSAASGPGGATGGQGASGNSGVSAASGATAGSGGAQHGSGGNSGGSMVGSSGGWSGTGGTASGATGPSGATGTSSPSETTGCSCRFGRPSEERAGAQGLSLVLLVFAGRRGRRRNSGPDSTRRRCT